MLALAAEVLLQREGGTFAKQLLVPISIKYEKQLLVPGVAAMGTG